MNTTKNATTSLVIGATGLVGGHLVQQLLEDEGTEKLTVIARRPLAEAHPKLELKLGGLNELDSLLEGIEVEQVFCAIGTTMKKAGSRAAFLAVDQTYPLRVAEVLAARGLKRYLFVSSVGAKINSASFYLRVKAEVEEALAKLPIEQIHLFRPSFLVGQRQEARLAEKLGTQAAEWIAPWLPNPLKKLKPIEAETVARGMLIGSRKTEAGVHIYESDAIEAMVHNPTD